MKTNSQVQIDPNNLPQHIAIIMDGNGRWAKRRFMPRQIGHRAGMSSLKETVQTCSQLGISVLTVFAFSTENWKRPADEVNYLMKLLVEYIHKELDELHENKVQIHVLGDYSTIPEECKVEIERAIRLTKNNQGLIFNIALNYGSRQEILDATRHIAIDVVEGRLKPEEINDSLFSHRLYTYHVPDPDLLIRTAGEMRISNFLLWQIAYSEIVVTNVLWPDFRKNDLLAAIAEYQKRDRRFGGLSHKQEGSK
ncbi:MAG TPA: isoprenyl transferase [Syntrophomonadaceae bacterium]|nr:isoprenyl transferase [Syntrophomonadaceae bacterium]